MNFKPQFLHDQPVANSWFALYTKHQHEKKTAEKLSAKGLEVYVPLYQAARQWKDRTALLSLPLFPGYVFLRTDFLDKTAILSTPGVFFLVESAGHACPIEDSEIESIRRINHTDAKVEPHPYLVRGDSVRIKKGPLEGISGILTRLKNECRIVLSVSLLRRSLSMEIDSSNVEKVCAGQKTCEPVYPGTRLTA
jgi:transcription antitermination factor NusG